MKKKKNCISITEGLFDSPLYFFTDIRLYFHRLRFLVKHGYAVQFFWDGDVCIIELVKQLVKHQLDLSSEKRCSDETYDLLKELYNTCENLQVIDSFTDKKNYLALQHLFIEQLGKCFCMLWT